MLIKKRGLNLQKIYVELVFLDNFIINFLILLLSSLLTRSKIRWGRISISAAIGGIYACAVFGTSGLAISVFVKVAVSLIMCFIAYYGKDTKAFLKNTCAFYITSFVLAGAVYATTFCFRQPQVFGTAFMVRPPARYILLGLGAGAALTALFSRVRKRVLHRERHSADLVLEYKGRREKLRAFVDTGNILRDPINGLSVVFVTIAAAKKLFDKDTLDILNCSSGKVTERLRIIPCTTAAGADIFYGIEIDRIKLTRGVGEIKAVVCIARASLAEGCDAVVGGSVMDELTKGAWYDSDTGTEDNSLDTAAAARRGGGGLYKRQRGPSASVDAAGRSGAAADAGRGGQVGQTGAD